MYVCMLPLVKSFFFFLLPFFCCCCLFTFSERVRNNAQHLVFFPWPFSGILCPTTNKKKRGRECRESLSTTRIKKKKKTFFFFFSSLVVVVCEIISSDLNSFSMEASPITLFSLLNKLNRLIFATLASSPTVIRMRATTLFVYLYVCVCAFFFFFVCVCTHMRLLLVLLDEPEKFKRKKRTQRRTFTLASKMLRVPLKKKKERNRITGHVTHIVIVGRIRTTMFVFFFSCICVCVCVCVCRWPAFSE